MRWVYPTVLVPRFMPPPCPDLKWGNTVTSPPKRRLRYVGRDGAPPGQKGSWRSGKRDVPATNQPIRIANPLCLCVGWSNKGQPCPPWHWRKSFSEWHFGHSLMKWTWGCSTQTVSSSSLILIGLQGFSATVVMTAKVLLHNQILTKLWNKVPWKRKKFLKNFKD